MCFESIFYVKFFPEIVQTLKFTSKKINIRYDLKVDDRTEIISCTCLIAQLASRAVKLVNEDR